MKAAVAIILLLILFSVALYEGYRYNQAVSQYNQLLSQDTQSGLQYNALYDKYTSLLARFSIVNSSLNDYHWMYDKLLHDYDRTQIIWASPSANKSIDIWTLHSTIPAGPNRWETWELLDTFDNHVHVQTNATAQFMVMSIDDYVNFATGKPYTAIYNSTGTDFNEDVTISQGCGGYVFVILNLNPSPVTVIPDVTATYAPTPFVTGVCTLR